MIRILFERDEEFNNKVKELKDNGLLDNFLKNCYKEIDFMGEENFLSDPKRISWLLNNPRFEVGRFQTNLTPEQLRLLTEELPYLIFNDQNTLNGDPEFDYNFLKMLVKGEGQVKYNSNNNEVIIDIKKRFINKGLTFEIITFPTSNDPWYLCEEGFEACVLRVNGEIVVLFPGSQEVKEDWIQTDLAPNLFHKVPDQYIKGAQLVETVKEIYKYDNIVLCGHSLSGGTVSYAGAVNDVNAFAIDPAPSIEGTINTDYDKILTIIPGGKSGGVLNETVIGLDGYYKSNTDIDIADGIVKCISNDYLREKLGVSIGVYLTNNNFTSIIMSENIEGVIASKRTANVIEFISKWGQANDLPSNNESVYVNSTNEKNDLDNPKNQGVQDGYKGYGGDHLLGHLDKGLIYGYVPLK